MAALALADALKDFGNPARPVKPASVAEAMQQPAVPVASQEMGSSRIEEAVEAAKQELEAKLKAEHDTEIEALKESHKQEIDRLQAEIGERAGEVVASGFEEMETRLVELTSSVAARILGIALTEDVQAVALEALAKAIGDAARDREAVRIKIRGPLSLYEALQPMLGGLADHVEFTESTSFDVTAAIDDALFETRLSEWSTALSEIMT